MSRLIGRIAAAITLAFLGMSCAQAQNAFPTPQGSAATANVPLCRSAANSALFVPCDATNKLEVNASVSASISGFAPGGAFATLTAAGTSGSVALPTGAVVIFNNTGTTAVSCTLGVGSATAVPNQNIIQPSSWMSFTVGSNTFGACIDQTGSVSNAVVLSGGTGVATGAGGGAAGGGSSAITTWAGGTLGAMANYGTSPGAVLVPGVNSFITNVPTVALGGTQNTNLANVDSATSRLTSSATNIVPGSALATTSFMVGARYNFTQATFTNGQEGSLQITSRGALMVGTGADIFNVTCANCSGSGVSAVDEVAFTAGTSLFAPTGGFFQTTATNNALTNGQQGMWQMTANRAGFVNLRNAAGTEVGTASAPVRVDPTGTTTQPVSMSAVPTGGATAANQATEIASLASIDTKVGSAVPAGTAHIGTVGVAPYPDGATPYTATATGTTAATTATLAGASSVTTYICGFSIRANATAAATGNATVTGVITATMNFTQWTAPNASGLGITEMIFAPCIPASTTNTSIAIVSAAPGTGGVVSVTAWGYKL